jgi:hypothetical protein
MAVGFVDMKPHLAALLSLLAVDIVLGQDNKPKPIAGQCHCGELKYEVQGEVVVESNYCDCRACQRATGTTKGAYLVVRQAGFRVVAGEPTTFRGKTGGKCDVHGAWHLCQKCGTKLFWKPDKGKNVDILAGTLDDTKLFQPKP